MSKLYFHKKAIEIPIYRGKFIIVVSNDLDKCNKLVNEFDEDIDKEIYAHAIYDKYKGYQGYFIFLNFDYPGVNITHGVIAHECVHVSSMLQETVGIKLDPNNDEPNAYLVNWFVDQIYEYIDKLGFKPQIKMYEKSISNKSK